MPPPLVQWTLGDVIWKLRGTRGLTQEMLADRAKLHRTTILNLESSAETADQGSVDAVLKALDTTRAQVGSG